MVFSFVDLFAEDFLLAAIVTFFVGKVNSSNDIIESVRDLSTRLFSRTKIKFKKIAYILFWYFKAVKD